jgi:hypothetical protein
VSQRYFRHLAASVAAVLAAAACVEVASHAQPESTHPQGVRLVRLLKKVADQALVLQPERMAKELDVAMTFETKPSDTISKACEDGGYYKSFLVTTAKVSDSWYKETPEGVPNMKIPPAFINSGTIAEEPRVIYKSYRTVRCASPNDTNVEARLSFQNLSGFSCLTPDMLAKLIGAKYHMATDGVSLSIYSPPATDDYGVSLEFLFRAGAPCAVYTFVDLNSRAGLREQRAYRSGAKQ